jgi:cytochrome c oxidase subunit I
MLFQGMAGAHRRWYDGGVTSYAETLGQEMLSWNGFMSKFAWLLGLFQLVFIFNFFWSLFRGK